MIKNLKKLELILTLIIILLLSFLNILPYFFQDSINKGLPLHNDELFHLNQAKYLNSGNYEFNSLSSLEIGFHFFLFILDALFNLIKIYPFLSFFWMIFTCIILFLIIYNLTNENYFISLLTLIFFGSIGIDNFYLGMSFFTPLTFSVPFIFLYFFLFFEGLRLENKKYLFFSLIIMILLLFFHPPSTLFFMPLILLYFLKYKSFLIKEYKFFFLFLLIPFIGILFYIILIKGYFKSNFLLNLIYFDKNWAGIETFDKIILNKLYSITNFILSLIGTIYLFWKKEKRYYPYIFSSLILLLNLICFNKYSFSLFGPAQRIYFYLLIFLPLFSAFGILFIFRSIDSVLNNWIVNKTIKKIIIILFLSIILFFSYYSSISQKINFNSLITLNKNELDVLMFLSKIESGNIILPLNHLSSFVKSFSDQEPIGTWYFYHPERKKNINSFYSIDNCDFKNSIIRYYHLDYILSSELISCSEYSLIYPIEPYVYNVSYLSKNYYTNV
jgi:hypothetical protein